VVWKLIAQTHEFHKQSSIDIGIQVGKSLLSSESCAAQRAANNGEGADLIRKSADQRQSTGPDAQ
jgi:hypothetical protein